MAKTKGTKSRAGKRTLGQSNSVSADEVARLAGVSVMTVSRALRGTAGVSPKTRDRIVQIATEIGYQPSQAARSLRTGKIETIGFLIWSHDALRGTYHSDSLAGIDHVVSDQGYNVLLTVPPKHVRTADYARRLVHERRVGSLVLQGARLSPQDLKELEAVEAPKVFINYTGKLSARKHRASCIGFDNADGLEQAVRHLVALGHERIAYIGGTPGDRDAIEREAGYRSAMKKLKLRVNEDWVRPGHFSHALDAGQSQGDYLIAEGGAGPTAIVCASDEIAYGVLSSARRAGLELPRQLSVVGFDDDVASGYVIPPLTTLAHSGWELGQRAGEELMRQITGDDPQEEVVILKTRLVVRSSTAAPGAR
ncbi:LacI family transcriptional regulator [bacterium]|nr:LacI family transcriptional regulator [bacterium]